MLMFALVASAMMANAQVVTDEYAQSGNKLLDNVYVGATVGATTPLYLNDVFPLNATFGLKVGKNFNPVFGANLEGTTMFGSHSYFGRFDGESHNAFRALNVGLNGTINLTNLFLGYKGSPRFFELGTETGLGWLHTFIPNASNYNNLSAKTALNLMFNVSDASQIVVTPGVYWNLSAKDKIQFDSRFAQLGLAVSYVYKFKTSNGTHNFKLYNITAMNDTINNLRAALSKKPTEVIKEVRVVEPAAAITAPVTIPFAFESAELSDSAKVMLDGIIKAAKAKGKGLNVYGYASKERNETTGYNLALSEYRAKAVARYIQQQGVATDDVRWFGASELSQRAARVFINE